MGKIFFVKNWGKLENGKYLDDGRLIYELSTMSDGRDQ
jgi:hypothetical protein